MTPPSIKQLVRLFPPRFRKLIRQQLLPAGLAERLSGRINGHEGSRAQSKSRSVKPYSAEWFEDRLWGGFSEDSLAALNRIKSDPASSPSMVSSAAWALSVWYASHGDLGRAHPEIVLSRLGSATQRDPKILTFIETDCLLAAGQAALARTIADAALAKAPKNACYLLTKANTFLSAQGTGAQQDDEQRLALINQTFTNAQLAPLRRKDASRPLSIDNLVGSPPPCFVPPDKQPRVSVLMAAHNCANTLRCAVEGLLGQSWGNLEILIVVDASSDGTFELAQQLSAEDARVLAYRQPEERGSYAARNLALRHATGEVVTSHGPEDWSHPQRIEVQMRHLLDQPTVPANCSDWVRCTSDLRFLNTPRVSSRRVHLNLSSLLAPRETVVSLGGWDEVRAGGDGELIRRLERAQQLKAVPRAGQGVPLAFAQVPPASFTGSKADHDLTAFYGVRRCYQEAASHWLNTRGRQEGWRLRPPSDGRTFPAPYELTTKERPPYDLLVIMDYALRGGAFVSTLNYIQAAMKLGKRVAVFHIRRYDLGPGGQPGPEILELAQDGQLYVLPPGGQIDVKTILVGYPPVLNSRIDLPPTIKPEQVFIITNQMHARLHSGADVQYDPLRVSANVVDFFGVEPQWIPISELVRKLMLADGRYRRIHRSTWTPLIETDTWCKSKVAYRGRAGGKPTIGRHSRDHYTKWPQSAEAIKAAYCANQNASVRLLGGATVPQQLLGQLPRNWQVLPFGSMEARDFLLGLDFYIHYPNEDYIEEFGRAVLEAMAVGVPVVLPSVFESTFGPAALYAEPADVWSIIERTWQEEELWEARSLAGRAFVSQSSDWTELASRLGALEMDPIISQLEKANEKHSDSV